MTDENVPQSPEVLNEREVRAANDGILAGVAFARWIVPDEFLGNFVRALHSTIPGPTKATYDFLDGFLEGASAEHAHQVEDEPLPFTVEWLTAVDINWGEAESIVTDD